MHLYPDGECNRIMGMIPDFPRRTRMYDYLQPEEIRQIAIALDDDKNKLTYRSKEEITFVQQKTGLEVCIPLRPVVGNAIYP